MTKIKKADQVSRIEELYRSSAGVIVAHYHGLTAVQMAAFRTSLSGKGAMLLVVKNSLSKIAAKNVGIELSDKVFSGPVALAYSNDPLAVAKQVVDFAKAHESLKVVAGIVNRKECGIAQVEMLAALPSFEELRAKLVGLLTAPSTQLVRTLAARVDKNNV